MLLKSIIEVLNKYYDESSAREWDNSGLQIGSYNADINKVLLCLDVNEFSVNEAVENGADLIISHHPLFFYPVNNIISDTVKGALIKTLILNNINVYSSHTCFDASPNGFNKYFLEKFDVKKEVFLEESGNIIDYGIGFVGRLNVPIKFEDLLAKAKEVFNSKSLKFSKSYCDKTVSRIALCTGEGSNYIKKAAESGAEVLITSDCKNSAFLKAAENNIALICPTHFETENVFIDIVEAVLSKEVKKLNIIRSLSSDIETFI